MSDSENQPQSAPKVNDRRRFTPEGDPLPPEATEAQPPREAQQTPPEEQAPKEAPAAPREDAEKAQLRSDLEAARKRVDELARAFQALDKDREEFKQRLNRERERMIDVEKGNVAQTLLEAIDELDLSLMAAEKDESPLAKGVRMIRSNLLKKLESTGIERVPMLGQKYDPNLAEAVDMEITADADEDSNVVGEIRAAYRMKDRVIRPGRVKVAKFVKPADA